MRLKETLPYVREQGVRQACAEVVSEQHPQDGLTERGGAYRPEHGLGVPP